MRIEVDMNGKIERTAKDSVMAFSNQEQYTILISKKIKQTIFRNKDRNFKIKFFSICLYLLLKDQLKDKEIIVIDEEYTGNERFIKSYLLDLIKKDFPEFDKRKIVFGRITKESNAHKIALLTYRGTLKPNKLLREEEILELIK